MVSSPVSEQSNQSVSSQKTMKSRMSHLVLVMEVPPIDPEAAVSEVEQDCDENKPLLRNEDTSCSTPSRQQGAPKVTSNYSLVPEALLPAQVRGQDVCDCLVIL